jgi:hypothetical protein
MNGLKPEALPGNGRAGRGVMEDDFCVNCLLAGKRLKVTGEADAAGD